MNVPQLAALAAATACFASYGWGLARFFRMPGGRNSGHLVIAGATGASIFLHVLALTRFYRHGDARFAAAMALYAVALVVFWWCVGVNRARPCSLAFSGDAPGHIVTSGPYALVRHPFYSSYDLCWVAGLLATGWWPLAGTVVVMQVIYHRAALAEEAKFAASPLGREYAHYAARTGRFLPALRRASE